jgi:hypothetical protein
VRVARHPLDGARIELSTTLVLGGGRQIPCGAWQFAFRPTEPGETPAGFKAAMAAAFRQAAVEVEKDEEPGSDGMAQGPLPRGGRGYSASDLRSRAAFAKAHLDEIESMMEPKASPAAADALKEEFKQEGLSERAVEWVFRGRRR